MQSIITTRSIIVLALLVPLLDNINIIKLNASLLLQNYDDHDAPSSLSSLTAKNQTTTFSRLSSSSSSSSKDDDSPSSTNFSSSGSGSGSSRNYSLVGCDDVNNITIIKEVGRGNKKVAYEVKLPTGEIALAKQYKYASTYGRESGRVRRIIEREAYYFNMLQLAHGRKNTVGFYGECDAGRLVEESSSTTNNNNNQSDNNDNRTTTTNAAINATTANSLFDREYTSFVEFGRPLLTEWTTLSFLKCFKNYFTEADIEDFRIIARQYASSITGKRFLLGPLGKATDNVYPQQYAIVQAGIRHIDMDLIERCDGCTYEEALMINCDIVKEVVNKTDLNCTLAYSLENPVRSNYQQHINITEAKLQCHHLLNITESYTRRNNRFKTPTLDEIRNKMVKDKKEK